jgi:hypothetical protein
LSLLEICIGERQVLTFDFDDRERTPRTENQNVGPAAFLPLGSTIERVGVVA